MNEEFEVIEPQAQRDAKKDTLERGELFRVLINAPAWQPIRSYVENMIQAFSNRAINAGFKDMEEYAYERGKVQGLVGMMSEIDTAIRLLEEERKK